MTTALPWKARSMGVSRRACETRLRSGGRYRARPTAAGKASWKATSVSMTTSTRKHWSPPRLQLASPHSVTKPWLGSGLGSGFGFRFGLWFGFGFGLGLTRLKTPVRALDISLMAGGKATSGIDKMSAVLTWMKPTRSKSMNLTRIEIEMESESMSGCEVLRESLRSACAWAAAGAPSFLPSLFAPPTVGWLSPSLFAQSLVAPSLVSPSLLAASL